MPSTPPRFKIDEHLPTECVPLLAAAGFDARTSLDQGLGGADDGRIAAACQIESRVLVTLDLDFADIRQYPPKQHAGLIVPRVKHQAKSHLLATFRRALALLPAETITGRLWIVTEAGVRVRGVDE